MGGNTKWSTGGGGTCWLAKFLERKSAGMFTFECVSEQPV